MALGFELVVPASWGDELIASRVLDDLADRPPGTAIMCSCPQTRRRLLSSGSELSPFMLSTVPPPVAAARYLRATNGDRTVHATFIGSCPGADDPAITETIGPSQFLELCAARGVSLLDQPRVFESRLPTDRHRHYSLPGGLPTPEALRAVHPGAEVLSVDAGAFAVEVAQCIISGRNALLDVTAVTGCACGGLLGESNWSDGRDTLVALEPPRSAKPVLDPRVDVDLDPPGQNAPVPAYEESVPLSVVVGADLSSFGMDQLDDLMTRSERAVVTDEAHDGLITDEPPVDSSARLPALAAELDFMWSESDSEDLLAPAAPVPDQSNAHVTRTRQEPVEPHDPGAHLRTGTPTGTPSVRTPAGPLPRAYLMARRIVAASGEHRALSAAQAGDRPSSDRTPDAGTRPDPVHVAAENAAEQPERTAPASLAGKQSAAGRGPVDSVLDMLSKAIRDVVEP
jgi:hypothetical protein